MGSRDIKYFKTFAKALLNELEYVQFSNALKTFFKNGDVGILCKQLMFIADHEESTDLLYIVNHLLPKDKKTEFNRKLLGQLSDKKESFCHDDDKENSDTTTRKKKFVILERCSLTTNFGFKIRGDLFTKQEIVATKVDKHSIADVCGLREGDRIVAINGNNCLHARKSDVIKIVKGAKTLHLEVISPRHCLNQNVENREAIETCRTRRDFDKCVTIWTNDQDGWLGCSIRGGTDYECDVHITSVVDGSPAQRAGIKKGDIIKEVNNIPLQGKTHFQAVDIIRTSSHPVTFTVSRGKPRGTLSSIRGIEPQPTPLRINNTRRSRPHTVGQGQSWLPSNQHGLYTVHPEGIPPPPYTTELPLRHQVLQRARHTLENMAGTETTMNNHIQSDAMTEENCESREAGCTGHRRSGETHIYDTVPVEFPECTVGEGHDTHIYDDVPIELPEGLTEERYECNSQTHDTVPIEVPENTVRECSGIQASLPCNADIHYKLPVPEHTAEKRYVCDAHIYDTVPIELPENTIRESNEMRPLACNKDIHDAVHADVTSNTPPIDRYQNIANGCSVDIEHKASKLSPTSINIRQEFSLDEKVLKMTIDSNKEHKNTLPCSEIPKISVSNACSSQDDTGTIVQRTLHDDIRNFKQERLRRTERTVIGTQHSKHTDNASLLAAISTAMENRARVFQSSFGSCDESYEWET